MDHMPKVNVRSEKVQSSMPAGKQASPACFHVRRRQRILAFSKWLLWAKFKTNAALAIMIP